MLINWLAQTVCGLQEAGEDLVLATVLSKTGSAPCGAGAKMVVRTNGISIGTVGGGILEATMQEKSTLIFKSGVAEVLSYDLSGEDAASMQMICGGNVKLMVDFIPASEMNIKIFRKLDGAVRAGKKCYLIAALGTPGVKKETIRCVAMEDGSLTGEFPYRQEWLGMLIEKANRSIHPVMETIADEQFVIERYFPPPTLVVYGAGHVSQQVALLAGMVDFRTVVLDDRSEYANRDRFPKADSIIVLDSFDECFAGLDINSDSYVVIVTRGHSHDKTVVTQALRTNAGYIGMMGSKRKRDELFEALQQDGFSSEELLKVHCPIGLAINAATPGEIAVSIIAELISARAQATK
jgi:xanthine dehydrogenase accessory factor